MGRVSFLVVAIFAATICYHFYWMINYSVLTSSELVSPTTPEDAPRDEATNIQGIEQLVCQDVDNPAPLWKLLCQHSFVHNALEAIRQARPVHLVQIGAHTGFESNDPFGRSVSTFLKHVTEGIHWTFVEPSPANFKRLQDNIKENADLCDMAAINAAVVSDDSANTKMTFYSIRDTIDPDTGYDSISGKTFPIWITQLSSFSMAPIRSNERQWKNRGLNMDDYIVPLNVTAQPYSQLVQGITQSSGAPFFVMIDTEGFDCNIVQGMSRTSLFLPHFLVFEHKQCGRKALDDTEKHLASMGYDVIKVDDENTLAVSRAARE